MKRFFEWIYKPSGNCPVQAEGYFLGYFFYFRARHEFATIEFYNKKEDFDGDAWTKPIADIVVKSTDKYVAGWLSKKECIFLVFKGCVIFLFKRKRSN